MIEIWKLKIVWIAENGFEIYLAHMCSTSTKWLFATQLYI